MSMRMKKLSKCFQLSNNSSENQNGHIGKIPLKLAEPKFNLSNHHPTIQHQLGLYNITRPNMKKRKFVEIRYIELKKIEIPSLSTRQITKNIQKKIQKTNKVLKSFEAPKIGHFIESIKPTIGNPQSVAKNPCPHSFTPKMNRDSCQDKVVKYIKRIRKNDSLVVVKSDRQNYIVVYNKSPNEISSLENINFNIETGPKKNIPIGDNLSIDSACQKLAKSFIEDRNDLYIPGKIISF